MTTVAAAERAGHVYFAHDSKVTGNNNYVGDIAKVFTNGPVTFGGSGTVRALNLLRTMSIPAFDFTDVDIWVTDKLIPAIIETLKTSLALPVSNGDASTHNTILAAVGGRVYCIGSDFGWFRSKSGLYAVGSGMEFALGALHAGASPKKAVKIAGKLDNSSGGKVHVVVV